MAPRDENPKPAGPSFAARVKAFFAGTPDGDGGPAGTSMSTPAFPPAIDTGHLHRRQAWTIRVLAICCGLLALSTASLGFAIAALVPLKRVDLALLQVDGAGNQVVEVKPLRTDMPVMDVMTRAWVQEYVLKRNTFVPDQDAMNERIRFVRERSSQPVFVEYANRNREFLPTAIAQRLSRVVQIRAVTRDKARNAMWFVDFVTTDTYPGSDPQTRAWRAQLFVEYKPRLTTAGELETRELTNPFGFTVQRYDAAGMSATN